MSYKTFDTNFVCITAGQEFYKVELMLSKLYSEGNVSLYHTNTGKPDMSRCFFEKLPGTCIYLTSSHTKRLELNIISDDYKISSARLSFSILLLELAFCLSCRIVNTVGIIGLLPSSARSLSVIINQIYQDSTAEARRDPCRTWALVSWRHRHGGTRHLGARLEGIQEPHKSL